MKIGIIAITAISNIGEDLLVENTKYLASQAFPGTDFKVIEIAPDIKKVCSKGRQIMARYIRSLAKRCSSPLHEKIINAMYYILYHPYYKKQLKDVDAVIYAFGMIKYSTQNAAYLFHAVNTTASKAGIPVFMNAMSIQKFSASDYRAKILADAVSMPCVKMITTRDSDRELRELEEHYLTRPMPTAQVGDTALWAPETLGIPRREASSDEGKEPKLIGINAINLRQFQIYGTDLSSDDFLHFYDHVIKEVTRRGWDYRIFHNGLTPDSNAAHTLAEKLDIPADKILPPPSDTRDYVSMLSMFDCVMAARFHTSLTCYAFGIPAVSIEWDNKITAFYGKTKRSHLVIPADDMEHPDIIGYMERALAAPADDAMREGLRQSTLQSFKNFAAIIARCPIQYKKEE